MKLAITQPNYLPWLGYFEMLDEVDVWVVLDNVQMSRRSFQVRNRVKSPQDAVAWLTVSVQACARETHLDAALLSRSDWPEQHWRILESYYRHAPCFGQFAPFLRDLLPPRRDETSVSRYNARVVRALCGTLGISVEVRTASELLPELHGTAEDKILALCSLLQPDGYYNSRKGVEAGLYHPEAFARAGLRLFKQDYQHPTYRQLGSTFHSHLSVVDLLFNAGSQALPLLRSGRRWVEMAPRWTGASL